MSNNHTSGTWFFGTFRETGASAGIDIGSSNSSNIALVHHQAQDRSALETKANARLIAAAPDLLQELRNIANADTSEWDDRSEFEAWAKNRARFAIAKAVQP